MSPLIAICVNFIVMGIFVQQILKVRNKKNQKVMKR